MRQSFQVVTHRPGPANPTRSKHELRPGQRLTFGGRTRLERRWYLVVGVAYEGSIPTIDVRPA